MFSVYRAHLQASLLFAFSGTGGFPIPVLVFVCYFAFWFYRCRVCLQDRFCNGGEANVTGSCTFGFVCHEGILKIQRGFWSPLAPTDWNRNVSLIAYRCPNDAACSGGDFFGIKRSYSPCSTGHEGVLCNDCTTGLVGRCGTCIHCYSPALSVFAIIAVLAVVLVLMSVLTAILLQESSGKTQVCTRTAYCWFDNFAIVAATKCASACFGH